jgi:hypothetical protein
VKNEQVLPGWTPPDAELMLALKMARKVRKWMALLTHKKPRIRDRARREIFSAGLWALQQGVPRPKE